MKTIKKLFLASYCIGAFMVPGTSPVVAHDFVPTTTFYDGLNAAIVESHCGRALDDWIKTWEEPDLFSWKIDGRFVPYTFLGAQRNLQQRLFSPEKATTINFGQINITAVPLGTKAFHLIDQDGNMQIDVACLIDIDNIKVLGITRVYNVVPKQ